MTETEGVRLQKVLSRAGVASRRAAEEMITDGRVSVDGVLVTEMGKRVDPDRAVVRVDGRRVNVREDLEYLALNKPRGMHTTMSDDQGRPCVGDLLVEHGSRLFHVGRLDADTEGLLLLTNDGDLAHRLTHPSFGIAKRYHVEIPGPVPKELGKTLREGLELDDGYAAVDEYRFVDENSGRAHVEVVLHEGRNRIVRRMFDAVGYPVQRLIRTAVGPVRLGNQRPRTLRQLSRDEVSGLYAAVDDS